MRYTTALLLCAAFFTGFTHVGTALAESVPELPMDISEDISEKPESTPPAAAAAPAVPAPAPVAPAAPVAAKAPAAPSEPVALVPPTAPPAAPPVAKAPPAPAPTPVAVPAAAPAPALKVEPIKEASPAPAPAAPAAVKAEETKPKPVAAKPKKKAVKKKKKKPAPTPVTDAAAEAPPLDKADGVLLDNAAQNAPPAFDPSRNLATPPSAPIFIRTEPAITPPADAAQESNQRTAATPRAEVPAEQPPVVQISGETAMEAPLAEAAPLQDIPPVDAVPVDETAHVETIATDAPVQTAQGNRIEQWFRQFKQPIRVQNATVSKIND